MKKISLYFCCLAFLLSSLVFTQKAHAKLPAKASVVMLMSGYGVAGGGILGLASLAFDSSGGIKRIFQGMSLGLYAGMAFGAYVVLSHEYAKAYGESIYPDDPDSTYDIEGADGGGDGAPERWNPYSEIKQWKNESIIKEINPFSNRHYGGKKDIPLFHINLIQINF